MTEKSSENGSAKRALFDAFSQAEVDRKEIVRRFGFAERIDAQIPRTVDELRNLTAPLLARWLESSVARWVSSEPFSAERAQAFAPIVGSPDDIDSAYIAYHLTDVFGERNSTVLDVIRDLLSAVVVHSDARRADFLLRLGGAYGISSPGATLRAFLGRSVWRTAIGLQALPQAISYAATKQLAPEDAPSIAFRMREARVLNNPAAADLIAYACLAQTDLLAALVSEFLPDLLLLPVEDADSRYFIMALCERLGVRETLNLAYMDGTPLSLYLKAALQRWRVQISHQNEAWQNAMKARDILTGQTYSIGFSNKEIHSPLRRMFAWLRFNSARWPVSDPFGPALEYLRHQMLGGRTIDGILSDTDAGPRRDSAR